MTATFGPYESSQQARDRAATREAVQRAENLVVGARLLEDPSPIMDRLTANNATYTLSAVERLVGECVIDAEQRQAITEKIVDESVQLVDDRGKTRLTTREVLEAERTLAAAADGLASNRRDVAIARPASQQCDEQQQRAYAYATDDDARLKVITGVPGAGKTRLIGEIGAAYQDAGYNVRAMSVANSAVDVLRRETDVPARSVAKELYEWSQDRERLTNRDLLIIDEVSTLGTAQGAALLRDAHERGAVVIALGDESSSSPSRTAMRSNSCSAPSALKVSTWRKRAGRVRRGNARRPRPFAAATCAARSTGTASGASFMKLDRRTRRVQH